MKQIDTCMQSCPVDILDNPRKQRIFCTPALARWPSEYLLDRHVLHPFHSISPVGYHQMFKTECVLSPKIFVRAISDMKPLSIQSASESNSSLSDLKDSLIHLKMFLAHHNIRIIPTCTTAATPSYR